MFKKEVNRFVVRIIQCAIISVWGLSFATLSAQTDTTFKNRFDQARNFLLENRTQKALPMLQALSDKYPDNSNISYLLGVCLTESDEPTDMSIYYLEKAKKDVSRNYAPNTHLETRAPIFLHYFLVVAYSQNGLCQKSRNAFDDFQEAYGKHKRDFYVQDAKWWIENCQTPKELETVSVGSDDLFKQELTEQKVPPPVEVESRKKDYVTKEVSYSTFNNLYGVQVGAFSKVVPIYEFEGLKNVDAFMDKQGMIRYVIGHFSSRKQAESLLSVVKEAGYTDAYIVNVNKERKYKDELVIFNDKSIRKEHVEKEQIAFSVQIGAFRDSIPNELAQKYLLIDDISELPQDDLVILKSGNFNSYQEASIYRDQLKQLGIPGTFVIAIKDGTKIPIEKEMLNE